MSTNKKTSHPIVIEHFAPGITASKAFSPMLQGVGTNRLTRLSSRTSTAVIDDITGRATLNSGTLTVFIEKYNDLTGKLRLSTHKLLDICTIALTAQNEYRPESSSHELNTTVVIPLEDYMTKCGIPLTKVSKDKTRRRVKEDLETLYNMSLEWSEPFGRHERDFTRMRVCDVVGVKNSNIIMNFSQPITRYLTHAYIMQYPAELLKIDERNPTGYYLGRKMIMHYGIYNNIKRGNRDIISVRALLEHAYDIPSYKTVMESDRHVEKRIIEPFEKSLDSLGAMLSWYYCNAGGEALTEVQLEKMSYQVFISSYIKYTVSNFPELPVADAMRVQYLRKRAAGVKKYKRK